MSPMLPVTTPIPHAPRRPGVCRECGCTSRKACATEYHVATIDGPRGPLRRRVTTATCSWVEDDLCSACHSPDLPTRAQAGELGRIRSFLGPIRVTSAADLDVPGALFVQVLHATIWATGPDVDVERLQVRRTMIMRPDGTLG